MQTMEEIAERLNVSYSLPEAARTVPGKGLAHLRNRLLSAATEDSHKATGLEHLEFEQFARIALEREVFGHAKTHETFLGAPWSGMMDETALSSKPARELRDFLYHRLKDKPLIELGAGGNGEKHARIFKLLFGVKSYTAVDMQDNVIAAGGFQQDALSFLHDYDGPPANIVAFGLFNEPMSPLFGTSPMEFMWPARTPDVSTRRQCEQEYLRRLAKEIGRVLPADGLLFGDGLHPIRICRDLDLYLQGVGIKHVGRAYAALLKADDELQMNDPFFMVKT